MSQVHAIIRKTRKLAALPGWSAMRVSREATLSKNALRSLDTDDFNPEARTLIQLERLLAKVRRRKKRVSKQ
jgi:ribosome-binding protein aMBF1 (putative translation factor)